MSLIFITTPFNWPKKLITIDQSGFLKILKTALSIKIKITKGHKIIWKIVNGILGIAIKSLIHL